MENKDTGLDALQIYVKGASERTQLEAASQFLLQFGPLIGQLGKLSQRVGDNLTTLNNQTDALNKSLAPYGVDFDDFRTINFINRINNSLNVLVGNSAVRLLAIETYYTFYVKPVVEGSNITSYSVQKAITSCQEILAYAVSEYDSSVVNFAKNTSALYLSIRQEYRRLRGKYMGANVPEEKDDFEDNLMAQLFGMKPPAQTKPTGPAISLIEDNCILTEFLNDLCAQIPEERERSVPIVKAGKVTSKTKMVRDLDEGEVESFAQVCIDYANSSYPPYILNFSSYVDGVAEILARFYQISRPLLSLVEDLLKAASGAMIIPPMKFLDIPNPGQLIKNLRKINFSNIRPLVEDTTPKTRAERDYSVARTKLYLYMKDTVTSLRDMQDPEEYSLVRAREAVKLKKALDDVTKTERQKRLKKDIESDNEFYVGKGGNLGSIEIEREAAPKIEYKDVKGESFVLAKEHIEEVIGVACNAQLMRISAPRGNVKSNILLIGAFGSGKTEILRAVAADKRIIGLSVSAADLLTAYMHESVKNIKRMYEHAAGLRKSSRYTKPVAILLDEFDRLFNYGEGVHAAYDGGRMTGVLQEMMDGVQEYEGVFIVGATNVPKGIPNAVLRRFKFVAVVGQLTQEERAQLFEQFLTKGLPISKEITQEDYMAWGARMEHAPGDVLGKVADEVHFKFIKELIDTAGSKIEGINKSLDRRLKSREINKSDFAFVKKHLGELRDIKKEEISTAVEFVMSQPQVQLQVNSAKAVYKDAEEIMSGLSVIDEKQIGLGFTGNVAKRSKMWKD